MAEYVPRFSTSTVIPTTILPQDYHTANLGKEDAMQAKISSIGSDDDYDDDDDKEGIMMSLVKTFMIRMRKRQ